MNARSVYFAVVLACAVLQASESDGKVYDIDENGYIIFCLCMGQFGNQVQHFLGGLAFAKEVNRTLVVPPWRTYKNIPFTNWFKLEPLSQYHRVILAEDFMKDVAAIIWPPENRIGFCYSFNKDTPCEMKAGNPFGPFWDGLGVNFASTESFEVSYSAPHHWIRRFPASKYPVVALKGAPAKFPMKPEHHDLQQYLQWSDDIRLQAQSYIDQYFRGEKYVGIHLRNGPDWVNACQSGDGRTSFMASGQCNGLVGTELVVNTKICLPSPDEVVSSLNSVVEKTGAKVVYVATDKYPYIKEIEEGLAAFQVKVFHQDPWLPQIDLFILGQSDYFIGNCVSSFTSFVVREREVNNRPTTFFGLPTIT